MESKTALEDGILRVEGLHKWFTLKSGIGRKTLVRAVDGVSFTVRRGETLGLVGESGCGKTTLARTIMRLVDPTKGSIRFDGQEISRLRGRELKQVRRKMQMVFQDPYASLDPRQSVESTLIEPMIVNEVVSKKSEARTLAEELIARVGLSQDHLSRFPHEFSGGQRQRIAIAAALAVRPAFLLLDEPTSSLDVSVQAQILRLLRALQKEMGLTYLFISHNLAVIRQMCERTAVMYLGRIVEIASTQRLFENPKHPYTRALLSSVPIPDPSSRKRLASIQGDAPTPDEIPSGCRFRTRCPYADLKCEQVEPSFYEVEPGHFIECHYDIDFANWSKM